MLLNNLGTYFYVRPSSVPDVKGTLYVRVLQENKPISIDSIKNIRIFPQEFDSKKQKPKPGCESGLLCTMFINEVNTQLNMMHLDCEQKGKIITKREIKQVLRGSYAKVKNGSEVVHPTFLNVYDMWMAESKEMIGHDICLSTYKQYNGYRYKAEVILESLSLNEAPIRNLGVDEVDTFQRAMIRKYAKGTVVRYMPVFSRIFEYAIGLKLISFNPVKEIKRLKVSDKEVKKPVWLEPEQLKAITDIELIGRDEKVRDAFVFCCWTGLAIGDYLLLDPRTNEQRIMDKKSVVYIEPGKIIEVEGHLVLCGRRQKSGTPYRIPLLPEAVRILEKYNGLDNLPYYRKKDNGQIIARLAQALNIKLPITWHIARRTMANYLLNVKMINPIYVVEIMGWKNIEEANAYVRVQESSLIRALFGNQV